MKQGTMTAKAVTLAKKKKGITRVDFVNLGFQGGVSRTIDQYFRAKGTKKVNGREYTNYVVR